MLGIIMGDAVRVDEAIQLSNVDMRTRTKRADKSAPTDGLIHVFFGIIGACDWKKLLIDLSG